MQMQMQMGQMRVLPSADGYFRGGGRGIATGVLFGFYFGLLVALMSCRRACGHLLKNSMSMTDHSKTYARA